MRERLARLERALGDPADPRNPLAAAAFLDADRRGVRLAAAERLLDDAGLGAEFVPRELGGRLAGEDALARMLRAVFRRDASLGLGYGLTSYLAAAVVWAGGSAVQRRESAELLLSGGKMTYAYPQPVPGNVFLQNSLTVFREGRARVLNGRKDAMNNAARARSLVLFASGPRHGEPAHTAFLVPGPAGAADWERRRSPARLLPRRHTAGVRGCLVQGVEFTGLRLGEDRLIGEEGGGAALLDRVFPAVRSTGPSMALGCADTALRTAAEYALGRGSRGTHAPELPAGGRVTSPDRQRRVLAGAFADLLACDSLALAATRSVHLLPRESAVLAAAVKYLLPTVLGEALHELSGVLGAASYATDGPYGAFQKAARDLPFTGLGAAGSAASREVLVRHLLRLPGLGPPPGGTAEADALFLTGAPVPVSRVYGEPWPPADGDTLVGPMETAGLPRPGGTAGAAEFPGEQAALLAGELRRLRRACGESEPSPGAPHGPASHARMCALADRYALIAAGTACLRVWDAAARRGGDPCTPSTPFTAGPEWAVLALSRLLTRLDAPAPPVPRAVLDRVFAEVVRRWEQRRSFDLYDTAIGG